MEEIQEYFNIDLLIKDIQEYRDKFNGTILPCDHSIDGKVCKCFICYYNDDNGIEHSKEFYENRGKKTHSAHKGRWHYGPLLVP